MSIPINLGVMPDGSRILYDVRRASNFNVGVCGFSGSGKSYTIRQLIKGYRENGIRSYVLDVHGDLGVIDGVPTGSFNNIEFSYTNGNGSINPIRIYPNEGPYIAISKFIDTVKLYASSLGDRQVSTLKNLLRDLYEKHGIYRDQPETWLNAIPELSDLIAHAKDILRALRAKEPGDTYLSLTSILDGRYKTELSESIQKDRKHISKVEVFDFVRSQYLEEFGSNALALLERDEEEDSLYDLARMESVVSILQDMQDSGLFGSDAIQVQGGEITRFVLNNLSDKDQLVIVHLLLDRIFNYAVRGCKNLEPSMPNMMVILDEGKIAKAITKTEMSPLNRIATEARKFGLGVVLGVQSPSHLTDDTFESCSLFIVLKLHPSKEKQAIGLFVVSQDDLHWIEPRRSGLVFSNSGRFKRVVLFQ